MNSDANTAAHRFAGPEVIGQGNLIGFFEFFNQCLVDHSWYASYQCCRKILSIWIKVPYSSEKILIYFL